MGWGSDGLTSRQSTGGAGPRWARRTAGAAARVLPMAALICLVAPGPSGRASPAPLAVDYDIQVVSGSALRNPGGTWIVQVRERIEWAVTWTVVNVSGSLLRNVRLVNHYSSEIDVDARSVNASRGTVSVQPVGGPRSATEVLWLVGDLPAGASATSSFRIATGTNPQGVQMYGKPGTYCLDSALTSKWKGGSSSFPCVGVHARELPWMRVEVDATRKDWRVRKPGDYASLGLRFVVASNGAVTVRFEDFGDLAPVAPASPGAAAVPVLYAAGDTLQQAGSAGWWSAQELSEHPVSFPRSEALRAGVAWVLWQRLVVSPHHAPLEYEGTGRVVFVLANLQDAVVGDGPGSPQHEGR